MSDHVIREKIIMKDSVITWLGKEVMKSFSDNVVTRCDENVQQPSCWEKRWWKVLFLTPPLLIPQRHSRLIGPSLPELLRASYLSQRGLLPEDSNRILCRNIRRALFLKTEFIHCNPAVETWGHDYVTGVCLYEIRASNSMQQNSEELIVAQLVRNVSLLWTPKILYRLLDRYGRAVQWRWIVGVCFNNSICSYL
jgi:hypothetical protein